MTINLSIGSKVDSVWPPPHSEVKYPCSWLEYSGHSGAAWFASFSMCIFFSDGLGWALAEGPSMYTSEMLLWGTESGASRDPPS